MDGIYSLFEPNYFHQSAALTLTAASDEFSPSYNSTSRNWMGFVINGESFYYSPSSWSLFSDQHITMDSIKIFNINQNYWLPGELLLNTILKMPNLEELSIKGTQVCTVREVAKILQSCPKMRKLDFSYTEKTQEEILCGLEQENISLDSVTAGFQKLTSLKLGTTVQDDTIRDPFLLVIKLLTFCRDCIDLNVEITYAGESRLSPGEYIGRCMARNPRVRDTVEIEGVDLFSQLEWMKSLKTLVLIKLGPYTSVPSAIVVFSPLLNALFKFLFPHPTETKMQILRPLRVLWIQDFLIKPFVTAVYLNPGSLQSYGTGHSLNEDENYEPLTNIQHFGVGSRGFGMGDNFLTPDSSSLENLTFAAGCSSSDRKMLEFCKQHPKLEYLSVDCRIYEWSDGFFLLPMLKFLSFRKSNSISQQCVDEMNEAFPNLESLWLATKPGSGLPREPPLPIDHDGARLSALSFPKLTCLRLNGFQLRDGACLLSIIKQCPKLEIVQLETDALDPTSFPSNLELFLRSADKLRDFRLEWTHKQDVYQATMFAILKAILKESIKLERLALIDAGSEKFPDWKNPPEFADFLIGFIAKMTHMTCCCITFNQIDVGVMNAIKSRVEEEMITERPSLWFHLDRILPKASDQNVPPIHYHQLVNPISFVMPRY